MSDADRETALVTGASAGIGREIASVLARRGFDLVLVARRAEELAALAKQLGEAHAVDATIYPLDLLEDGAGERLASRVAADGIAVDLLVNNAGLIDVGTFHELPLSQQRMLVRLNVEVLMELTHRFVRPMVDRGRGRILNVASLSSFQPVPTLAVYAASKAFVLSFSEALSEELRDTGVTVTALCPGFTRTDMVERAKEASDQMRMAPDFLIGDAGDVAEQGVDGCLAARVVVVPGVLNQLQASSVGFYPRWLVRALTGAITRLV